MKSIIASDGNPYPVIDIINNEWAIIARIQTRLVVYMLAVHLQNKTNAMLLKGKEKTAVNEFREFLTPLAFERGIVAH